MKRSSILSWLMVTPALVLPAAFAWGYFLAFGGTPVARGWYAVAKGFLLVWPLLCWLLFRHAGGFAPRDGTRRLGPSVVGGLGWGACVVLLMAVLWTTPAGTGLSDGAESIRTKLEQFGVGEQNYWGVAVAFSAVHSALEEYYWRWFVYGRLRCLAVPAAAHLLAAAGFSLHHGVALSVYFGPGTALWMAAAVGVGGLVWTGMYERWRTLAGPWISHVMVDLAIFWFAGRILEW